MGSTRTHALTIASGDSASGAMSLVESSVGSLLIPAAFTGTTLTFQASATLGGTYAPIRDADNALVSLDVTTSAWLAIPTAVMAHENVKAVSDVAVSADQIFSVVTKVP